MMTRTIPIISRILSTFAVAALLLVGMSASLGQPARVDAGPAPDPADRFDDHSLCLPIGDPPAGGYEPYTGGVKRRGEVVIGGVPGYDWRHGCGPTAAGMVIGYWDGQSYSALVSGDASTQTSAVNQMIASGNGANTHYSDYSQPIDDPGTGLLPDKSYYGGAHASDCVGDFMETSWYTSSNYYGWSRLSRVDNALRDYVTYVNAMHGTSYTRDCWNEYFGTFGWSDLVAEVDAGRPMVFLVDTDGDGDTDHFVTAIGYRDTQGYNEYGCLDTWAPPASIRWERFRAMASGDPWGICAATYCVMGGACPVNFTTQPEPSQTACPGDDVTLHVETDALTPEYQWRRGETDLIDDGVHISGATTDTLSILDVTPADDDNDYNCVVYDAAEDCYAFSDLAEILVAAAPVILDQPDNVVADEGTVAIFNVTVEDPILVSFQWRKDTMPLSDDERIIGSTTTQLIILNLVPSDAGGYDCVITFSMAPNCATTSDSVTLTVNPIGCPNPGASGNYCLADVSPNNGDGVWNYADDGNCVVDIQDLSELLAGYGTTIGATRENGDIYPTGGGDGAVGIQDLSELLGQYGDDCN